MAERETTWHALLAEKKAALANLSSTAQGIATDVQFRAAYERLCDEHYQDRAQRYLAHFLRLFKPFAAFTGGIDYAGNLTAPSNLTSLHWASAYSVIEAGTPHRSSQDLSSFIYSPHSSTKSPLETSRRA